MTVRKDWLEHQLEQLAEALKAIFRLRQAGKVDEARAALHAACAESLGMEYRMLVKFDASSVAGMLATRPRIEALAALVDEDAALFEADGKAEAAASARRHAEALRAEARLT